MPHLDAIGVMNEVKNMGLSDPPMFMTMTAYDNKPLQNELMRSGSVYHFLQPFDIEVMAERIVQMASVGENSAAGAINQKPAARETDLEMMVTEIIHQIGVPAHIKGYQYLRESIRLSIEDPEMINSVTK